MADTKILFPSVADAALLAEVQIQTFRHTYANILPDTYLNRLDKRKIQNSFAGHIQDPDKHLVTAKIKDNVIGYGYFTAQRMPELPYAGEIIEFYVHPDFHGQGIGKKMFHYVASLLPKMAFPSFNVWVLAANEKACRFYETMGGKKLIEGDIYWPEIEDKTFNAACYYWDKTG